jgi:hypothetical protein
MQKKKKKIIINLRDINFENYNRKHNISQANILIYSKEILVSRKDKSTKLNKYGVLTKPKKKKC